MDAKGNLVTLKAAQRGKDAKLQKLVQASVFQVFSHFIWVEYNDLE